MNDKKYGIWGLAYKNEDEITDIEVEYGCDLSYEEAREIYIRIYEMKDEEFFKDYPENIKLVTVQLEEYTENFDEETNVVSSCWFTKR